MFYPVSVETYESIQELNIESASSDVLVDLKNGRYIESALASGIGCEFEGFHFSNEYLCV